MDFGWLSSGPCVCYKIICTHHSRSLTHNSTMTSADGICLLPSMTHPSNLELKDTGHRPCQRRMIDSSSHELSKHISKPLLPLSLLHLAFFPFLTVIFPSMPFPLNVPFFIFFTYFVTFSYPFFLHAYTFLSLLSIACPFS